VQHRLERAAEIAGGAADQLEHVGAGRLLGPRLGELAHELGGGGFSGDGPLRL
jgi:hypothetical protein